MAYTKISKAYIYIYMYNMFNKISSRFYIVRKMQFSVMVVTSEDEVEN